MNQYKFEELLDMDYLDDSQKKVIEALIVYEIITKDGNSWLSIDYEGHYGGPAVMEYCLDGSELGVNGYKQIMWSILQISGKYLSDKKDISEVTRILSRDIHIDDTKDLGYITVGSSEVEVRNYLKIKAQDFYRAMTILNKAGLV